MGNTSQVVHNLSILIISHYKAFQALFSSKQGHNLANEHDVEGGDESNDRDHKLIRNVFTEAGNQEN